MMKIKASRLLLILLLSITLCFKMAVCTDILPSRDYVAFENNLAILKFNCSGNGTSLFWNIDGHPTGSLYVRNKGIQPTPYISSPDGLTVSSQLIVPTTKANNNITVICIAGRALSNYSSSDPVKLFLQGILDAPYNVFVTFSNATFVFFWGAPFSLDVTDYSPDILHYILCSNLSTYECKQIPSNPDCTFPSVCTMSLDVNDSLVNGGRDLIVIDYGSVIEFTFFAVNGAGNGNVATATYIGMTKTGFQTMVVTRTLTVATITASPVDSVEYNKTNSILYGAIGGATSLMISMAVGAICLSACMYIRCQHKGSITVEQNNAYQVASKYSKTKLIQLDQNSAYEGNKDLAANDVMQCIQCEQNNAYQEAIRPVHHWTREELEPCPAYGVVV